MPEIIMHSRRCGKTQSIIELRKLTEMPGNCFSCRMMTKFTPLPRSSIKCGFFEDEFFTEGNKPKSENCEHWAEKFGQKVITYNGQFAGLENH